MMGMTNLRKVLPLILLALVAVWTFTSHPGPMHPRTAYAQQTDCSSTFTFTGNATQNTVSNLSGNTPCVNWRVTLSTTGTLTTTVTFYTSPDASTWTAVPNTLCAAAVQPPCIFQGANPITGTQGMLYTAAYGSYVRVVTTGSSGTGTGTVRMYGAKGASASAMSPGGTGTGTVTSLSFTGGLISVANPTTAPALTVAGTSGGVVYFSSASTWASSGALTANGVVLGGGAGAAPTVTAADSTTTHALFATAGAPAFRALTSSDLPAGTGTVTSVGWTGGIVTVATGTTTPAFTIAGTSGGIPYFSSASTWASSGALTANGVVLGGGAGAAPTVTAADSTTTHALFATAGAPAFRALALTDLPSGTGKGTGTLNVIPKWSNTTGGLQDSSITDTGTTVTVPIFFDVETASLGTPAAFRTPNQADSSLSYILIGKTAIAGEQGLLGYSLGTTGASYADSYMFFANWGDPAGSNSLNIKKGGNVLIGSTSDNGAKLQVAGAATVSTNLTVGATSCAYGLCIANGVGLSGTALFKDVTATTGSTLVTITPGAAQTSASTVLSVEAWAQATAWVANNGQITQLLGTGLNKITPSDLLINNVGGGQVLIYGAGIQFRTVSTDPALLIDNTTGRLQFKGATSSFPAIANGTINGFAIQSAAGTTTYNDAVTAGSGTVAQRDLFLITAPTMTATNASVTYTNTATLHLGLPVASTNVTFTNPAVTLLSDGPININASSFLFNGKTCTIVSTVVTCV